MSTWILLGIVALIVVWAIALYNRLIGLRNQVLNGWRQIDVQLKRRHDLIPNLVNTVRGAMEFERDTLTQVMEARARAVSFAGARPSVCRCGELPHASRQRQRQDAAGGADVHREQGRVRAAVLQRHRHEIQHITADLSVEPVCLVAGIQAG
jgi:hypothetical protein